MSKKAKQNYDWVIGPCIFIAIMAVIFGSFWVAVGGETLLGVKLAKEDCSRLGGSFTWSERWVGRYTYSCEFKPACEKKAGDECICRDELGSWRFKP